MNTLTLTDAQVSELVKAVISIALDNTQKSETRLKAAEILIEIGWGK